MNIDITIGRASVRRVDDGAGRARVSLLNISIISRCSIETRRPPSRAPNGGPARSFDDDGVECRARMYIAKLIRKTVSRCCSGVLDGRPSAPSSQPTDSARSTRLKVLRRSLPCAFSLDAPEKILISAADAALERAPADLPNRALLELKLPRTRHNTLDVVPRQTRLAGFADASLSLSIILLRRPVKEKNRARVHRCLFSRNAFPSVIPHRLVSPRAR